MVLPKNKRGSLLGGYKVFNLRFNCTREYLGFAAFYREQHGFGDMTIAEIEAAESAFSKSLVNILTNTYDGEVSEGMYSMTLTRESLFRFGKIHEIVNHHPKKLAVMRSEGIIRASFSARGLQKDSIFSLCKAMRPRGERLIYKEPVVKEVNKSVTDLIRSLMPFDVHMNRSFLFHMIRLKLYEMEKSNEL